MEEEKTNEEAKKVDEGTTTPADEGGNKSEADIEVERLNADTERINKAIAENKHAKAQAELGGVSEAGSKMLTKEESESKKAEDIAEDIVGAFQ